MFLFTCINEATHFGRVVVTARSRDILPSASGSVTDRNPSQSSTLSIGHVPRIIMTTLAKSHNVCTGCRSRKKKCDGGRPSCSSCLKRADLCFYAGAPSQTLSAPVPTEWLLISDLDTQQDDGIWAHGTFGTDTQPVEWPTSVRDPLDQGPAPWPAFVHPAHQQIHPESPCDPSGLPTPSGSSTPPSISLPPPEQLSQLVDLYFDKFYQFLPIIHKPTLKSKVKSRREDDFLILFSVIAISASAHPNREIQQMQVDWYNEAKRLFSKAIHFPESPLQTVQAASFIILQSMLLTEYSTAWVVLGEGWRKAVSMGCNVQDGGIQAVPGLPGLRPGLNWIDKEEGRRAVWMLFIFDRGMCFPIGLAHTIDDRQLRINFPMNDDVFHRTTAPLVESDIRYTSNLDRLITSVQEKIRKKTATLIQLIILAYIFLGRVSERIYTLDFDMEEQKPHLDALASHLLRMRLMLPRSATDLSAADYRDFGYVVWLNAVMSVSTILLYHKPLHEGETLDGQSDLTTNWPHCVIAARGTVSIIRDASRTSADIIINAHLSSQLFACGRILTMEYLCPSTSRSAATSSNPVRPKDPALRDDLEILLLTFERMKEALKGVGRKFRNGLVYCLQEDETDVLESKARGSSELLKSCASWPQVDNDEEFVFPI
ncbi:hypothetical protein AK830_g9970 [Neonectria ditissima]|uniref:Zn(2)-C6 fungal-type domain-containing protein n=1 Tax=Neonectria ditissima TaxID=78410 RepID=A0A0P7AGV3_9HYPO|nr:hypothetical protein AK830_g9970 [Neonectria ditissima]